ncbi:dna gyrase inhibitor : DNA gyrase inhibitor YacG OS=Cystobacter violaceus Cb vi76 GN=yacG PE=3 SV=1: DUF329 [Tuwongella immobilis]|uniref:DNA gyrase inhibitor YacG n=2 Tax=Tuwongella immobilis TaxID=692036 RepID=A0A6C2YQJ4_9BACT|nr:dna gyrase inhibitor : DNA gyrase inhibitor YacG OS=Cystobacter violaceus Cb vi76 GN=yacG PE=3 SV=1: DUF329 [Tuwongella immobilis]VTS03913.1 dna gyrase inhibitor : DNA gyrase inhibitor YacG OS=Cystobacter violaceus Cb vi76 GN=yacG PE=3 SV=1: DUF329 [Tuwongella immobilis]
MPGNSLDWPDYPFCSKRCRTIDLGRWLDEAYRVPRSNDHDEADSAPHPEDYDE